MKRPIIRAVSPRRNRWYRSGFSLIELLIVVAIIAALVGVAVPMFQNNIAEAHIAKARQDLDTIRSAINLHDSQNRPLVGTSLKPLEGRYLQAIEVDPWGNPYYVDAGVGILVSFGGDNAAGGEAVEDQDLITEYKGPLRIQKAVLEGSWGSPQVGHKLRITFNKPISNTADPSDVFVVIKEPAGGGSGISLSGTSYTSGTAYTWGGATWAWTANATDANYGVVTFSCTQAASGGGAEPFAITPTCGINLVGVGQQMSAAASLITTAKLSEVSTPGGPMDPKFGANRRLVTAAKPIEMVGTENRGVPITLKSKS